MTLDKISSYWHTWLICKENMNDHFSKLIFLTIKADALKTSIWSIITVTSLLKYFILSLTYNYYYYKFFFVCVCVFTCSQTFLLFNTPKKKSLSSLHLHWYSQIFIISFHVENFVHSCKIQKLLLTRFWVHQLWTTYWLILINVDVFHQYYCRFKSRYFFILTVI